MELLLKEFRKARGMTQDDLAAAINTTKRVVGSYERRETLIPLEVAYDITEVLGCTLDELCGRKVDRSFLDNRQEAMNVDYEGLTEGGKDAAAGAVKGIRITEGARGRTQGLSAVAV